VYRGIIHHQYITALQTPSIASHFEDFKKIPLIKLEKEKKPANNEWEKPGHSFVCDNQKSTASPMQST
jgi:hypothetical protein